MDSFRGWRSDLSLSQFKRQLGEIGLVLAGQTAELAPADGRLYALRDVTGTVASLPLIAASIMSKKLAAGADAILLDVKAGSGAFMESVAEAKDLARMMVDIGNDAGRAMTALISDMNQPLGFAVGNALEVKEAIATLLGEPTAGFAVPEDFWEHCQVVAAHMLLLVNAANDLDAALAKVTAVRDDGSAWEKFRQMVIAQGGSADQIDDPRTLPAAQIVAEVKATAPGYIAAMDVAKLGWATVHLGAGRQEKGQPIDHAVGFVMPAKVGDYVEKGGVIAMVHANDESALDQAREQILGAISWSQQPTEPLPQFYGTITG
jgi:pyrimidine-nucleoside phosphorylase